MCSFNYFKDWSLREWENALLRLEVVVEAERCTFSGPIFFFLDGSWNMGKFYFKWNINTNITILYTFFSHSKQRFVQYNPLLLILFSPSLTPPPTPIFSLDFLPRWPQRVAISWYFLISFQPATTIVPIYSFTNFSITREWYVKR